MLRHAYWVVLAAASVLAFVSVWIVVPAPIALLLPLGVGSPEISPVLLCGALLLSPIAAMRARKFGTARLALVCTLTCGCLSLLPIVQAVSAFSRFDKEMARIDVPHGEDMRKRAIDVRGLFMPLDSGRSSVTRGIPFAAPDRVTLKLDVYQPRAAGQFPVIMQIYGGAWQNGAPSDFDWFARYFAAHGHLVVAIDYRHAPAWRWPEQLEDVRSGLRWVAEHASEYHGDATRIALVGRSSGAHLAMRAAYQEAPSAIKGVVNFYGPVDLADGWRNPPKPDPLHVRDVLEAFLGGTPDQIPDRYRHASPITYASGSVPATMSLYGSRDHVVAPRFGRMIHTALRKGGNVSILLEFPWSEHAFDIVPNGLGGQISLYYVERFLAAVLRRP